MTLLADGGATYLFLAALLVSTGFVLFRTHRRLADTARSEPRAAPRPTASQRTRDLQPPPAAVRWELQMHELARDVSARVDSKLAALEHLMQAAHAEASRLEAAVCEARRLGLIVEPSPAAVAGDAESGQRPPLHQASALEQAARQAACASPTPLAAVAATDRPYARIYALADAGADPHAIAASVGSPVGEVQLILSLRTSGRS